MNHDVDPWVDKHGEPNTVTLCNGSECATYRYVKLSGQSQLIGKIASAWKGEYPGGGGGTGGVDGLAAEGSAAVEGSATLPQELAKRARVWRVVGNVA